MSARDSPCPPPPPPPSILKTDAYEAVSPSTLLGIDQVASPRSAPKTVSIAPHAEHVSPLVLGNQKEVEDLDLDADKSSRRPKVKGPNSRRLSGRPGHNASTSSLASLTENGSVRDFPEDDGSSQHHLFSGGLVGQVTAWIRAEKAKKAARKAKRRAKEVEDAIESSERRGSQSSDESVDLIRLEQILKESFPSERPSSKRSSTGPRRRPSVRNLHRASTAGASSDTEYFDGDILVPSAEAWLDNSKILGYAGGAATVSTDELTRTETSTTREAWAAFKFEIVRLSHTLRLKGWRRVPMEMSSEIDVERLSGALTNAVYVVSPPANIPSRPSTSDGGEKRSTPRPPPKLLLRIYGPQVEHLIDREAELQILRRLARKKIGPRLLGTFSNGRFEEFFHARTLTPADLRNPDTGRQIAKRMRELHEGIELLEKERNDGAFVWRNWDNWVQRVEEVVSWCDKSDLTSARGHVCGVEWPFFRQTVEKYRAWLEAQYGGVDKIREKLVFAHNDVSICPKETAYVLIRSRLTFLLQTQYGNILRLLPSGESPLLLPANTHKQLIVIDFEYANANTPGLEFANHFTEWCYNYHDPVAPYACNTAAYPTPEEQDRFVRAYVRHRPQFNATTPKLSAQTPTSSSFPFPTIDRNERPSGPTHSINSFMLDARAPPTGHPASSSTSGMSGMSGSVTTEPFATPADQAAEDAEVAQLLKETRLWRLANTAMWIAWGIIQAKVPGMPASFPPAEAATTASPLDAAVDPNTAVEKGLQGQREAIPWMQKVWPPSRILRTGGRIRKKELRTRSLTTWVG
ncbi:hypothetical protein H2203_001893 [Taxawa tesnikishii (nom. ined.)]|nr:hypothetical protein H2203_001893 [Dothideales sp. JES 119]